MSQTLTRQRSFYHSDDNKQHTPTSYQQQHRQPTTPPVIRRTQDSVVTSANDLISVNKQAKKSARWCLVNLVLLTCCYFRVFKHIASLLIGSEIVFIHYLDPVLSVLFLWNVIANTYIYCQPVLRKESIVLSPKQKLLLGISKDEERLFQIRGSTNSMTSSPHRFAGKTQTSSPSSSSSLTSTPAVSYPIRRTPSRVSPGAMQDYSPSRRYSSTNLQYSPSKQQPHSPGRSSNSTPSYTPHATRQTPTNSPYTSGASPVHTGRNYSFASTPSPNVFLNNSSGAKNRSFNSMSPSRVSSQDEQLLDYESLDHFIKKEEENDARMKRGKDSPMKPSFWKYGRSSFDYVPSFSTYQLASQTPNKNCDDVNESPFKQDETWRKLGFNRHDVTGWTENIRKWLAQTVLEPLVSEITNINKKLTQMGNPELNIGTTSISSLQSVTTTKGQHFPSLNNVILYLNLTSNQEYLWKRLKELSNGGCLRSYNSDGGGSYNGKSWNTDLPTDAQIMMHLFCTYMDTFLPSNPRFADGKSFTGMHFLKTPLKPEDKKSGLCIYQSRTQKPHFKVLLENEVCELPKGQKNMFFAIVIFLYYAKQNYHGMLQRVNLGLSGINVLWVLDKQ